MPRRASSPTRSSGPPSNMGDWPKRQVSRCAGDDLTPAGNPDSHDVNGWYVLLTAGVANVKGAYSQLIASTPFDVAGLLFFCTIVSAGTPYLMDIAIGGAGSEQVVVPNLPIQSFR